MPYRNSSTLASLLLIVVAAALLWSCGDDAQPTVGSNNDNSVDLDAGATDTNNQATDAGAETDAALAEGTCTGNDTSSCTPPPNASTAGCVLGSCAYQCEAGYADDNGDLGEPDSDGCESDCIPTGDELCDGIDNDCDGQTDEDWGVMESCTIGVGACQAEGTVVCAEDEMSTICMGDEGTPTAEVCDGIDNDCDGATDEDDPAVGLACSTNAPGICSSGVNVCEGGALVCEQDVQPENEVCDGIDNDCDGNPDNGNPGGGAVCNTGLDGICASGIEVCDGNGGYDCQQTETAGAEDCGADATGNGLDDDCDGEVDEGCADCVDGSSRSCYTGPSNTQNVGLCSNGTQTCNNGLWGSCDGETLPTAEVCNGFDDNCNGTPDEDFSNKGQGCSVGLGACERSGVFECSSDGSSTVCGATPGPSSAETCNGIDDNCNGSVDENLTRSCGTNAGACSTGTETCSSGSWGACVGGQGPVAERCNGIDDNCNGTADEDFSSLGATCVVGTGACERSGTVVCNGTGSGTTCSESPGMPTSESCNGIDDNCNGSVDENLTRSCGTNTGACETGTQTCNTGSWGTCVGQVTSTAETCNGMDDDCDGITDNGFNIGTPCTVGTGACQRSGTRVCNSSGNGTTCDANPGMPGTETCNGIDDDCNGLVDDNLTRSCGTNTGACSTGTQTCSSGSWGSCNGSVGPRPELCNGIDDDCDGVDDNGVLSTFYLDADDDNYGTSASITACAPSGDYDAAVSGDCDDSNSFINPDATEFCSGTVDRDCDGFTGCSDAECEGQGCVTSSQFGTCIAGSCVPDSGGDCNILCNPGSYCVDCGFDDFCCPDGQLCACR